MGCSGEERGVRGEGGKKRKLVEMIIIRIHFKVRSFEIISKF